MMGNDKEQWRMGGWEKKTKEANREEKGRVLSWEDVPDSFISACKMFSSGYLPLVSFK